ncbi:UNVERIFIED_CONTAM: Pre-splicing factor cwc22 [Sesamum radiatum]|uniref:Pre-splicing factor cwc22 n=1 Tax=Sesamum radiatum TaxID=300843 RepID=A0AAW2W727_SESRA
MARRHSSSSSESEESEKEVRHHRERRRERNDDESREKAGRRREEKGNHGNRDSNPGRDSGRDDRRLRNGRDDEINENGRRSRKEDGGRERKLRHDEADDEDYRKAERRRHRDYGGEDDKLDHKERDGEREADDENNRKAERWRHRDYGGEDDKIGHKERDGERDSYPDTKRDRRDRDRRSERGREGDDEKAEYRSREDHYKKYDSRDDDRKERRRDRERERERHDKDDDKDKRKREKNANGSEVENTGLSKKGDGKGIDVPKMQKPVGNVVVDEVANLGRSGGVYIPPFKLARMMKDIQDKSSVEYQRMTWDALRKSINGLVNKVNATNIKNIIPELFAENLIRGRGLFCRSCMKSQMASPGFTDVFAALVAVVNTKFPEVGDLLLRRIILQLQRAYKRNDKPQLLAAVKFIAHLVNQQVVHELIALELLTLLLEKPTDDSVEVAVGFVTECGSILQDLSPRGLHGIFERFRGILHEGEIDKRVQFLIEGLFALRKAKFQGYPAVRPELDLVEQEDQLTHEVSLLDEIDPEITLDIFKPDPQFSENEKRYEELKKQILGEESDDDADSDADAESDDEDDEESEDEEEEEQMKIKDETETNLINLRRTIYLTIMSSVDFEEAGHKLLKIKLEPGQEVDGIMYYAVGVLQPGRYYNLPHTYWTSWDSGFLELSEHLGIRLLNERLSDPAMQDSFESIFPRDNPKNTRFSINFFTSIGLGGITENLREYLKNMPRLIMQQQKAVPESDSESGSSSSDSEGSGSESGSSSSESSDSESETDSEARRKKKRRRN